MEFFLVKWIVRNSLLFHTQKLEFHILFTTYSLDPRMFWFEDAEECASITCRTRNIAYDASVTISSKLPRHSELIIDGPAINYPRSSGPMQIAELKGYSIYS